jgi:hypothetical protein
MALAFVHGKCQHYSESGQTSRGGHILKNGLSTFLLWVVVLDFVIGCQWLASAQPADPGDSGIEGLVLLGPTKPVMRQETPSVVPFATTLVVQDGDRRRDLMTIQSGGDGTFRVPLPPGAYWIVPRVPEPGRPPIAEPSRVLVEPHRFTRVEIHYDTGLR